ncbi:MAG: YigZ family protein [Calditrichaeota bacterium]|nr:YigZ family protein [Calditrichota bacterium]
MNSSSPEFYKTIPSPVTAEIKIKGSRFIATAVPVTSKENAEEKLAQLSRRYHDATHHCFAYRIGTGNAEYYRSSDAGEPAGTAGQPILQVIRGMELTHILVVVTRYFGGTKLGIGGLIKAYTEATQEALKKAKIREIPVLRRFHLKVDYAHISDVMRNINAFDARIAASDYGESVRLQVDVPVRNARDFRDGLINSTAGQIQFEGQSNP